MGSDASLLPVTKLWAICYGNSSGKNTSGVRDSLINVGKGYREMVKFSRDFRGRRFAEVVSVSLFFFAFNCLLQFFHSFIITGFRVLSELVEQNQEKCGGSGLVGLT